MAFVILVFWAAKSWHSGKTRQALAFFKANFLDGIFRQFSGLFYILDGLFGNLENIF